MKSFLAALLFATAVLPLGCGHGNTDNEANAPQPPAQVGIATLRRQTVPITDDYEGTLGAIESVDVRARVVGTLESAPFKEGDLVQRGQLIFTLQRQPYAANVQLAQAKLGAAHSSLEQAQETVPVKQAEANVAQKQAALVRTNIAVARLRPLAADKAVPQKDLDNAIQNQASAGAEVEAAVAQLQDAKVNQKTNIQTAQQQISADEATVSNTKLDLSYTQIFAPVTGLIGFLKYDVGNIVGDTGNEVLDTITSIDPIKVTFALDEPTFLELLHTRKNPEVQSLREQDLQLFLADDRQYPYTGRIYTYNPTIDPKTGTIAVEARFPNPEGLLRPGGFVRVRLVTQHRSDALLVPQTAITKAQGVDTVYVVNSKNEVELRTVSLGAPYGQSFLVRSGLNAGENVIVEGTQKVQPGAKVVIKAK